MGEGAAGGGSREGLPRLDDLTVPPSLALASATWPRLEVSLLDAAPDPREAAPGERPRATGERPRAPGERPPASGERPRPRPMSFGGEDDSDLGVEDASSSLDKSRYRSERRPFFFADLTLSSLDFSLYLSLAFSFLSRPFWTGSGAARLRFVATR